MALDSRRTDGLEPPGKHLGQAFVNRKGGAILQQHLFERAKGSRFQLMSDAQGDGPFNQRLHEQGKRRFAQLIMKGFVGNLLGLGQLQGIEMTVQACDTLDAVATQRPQECGPQECGDQHGRGDAALTQAELAGPSDAFEFGRRKELIEIVVGVDNGHGFGRVGFVWR